MVLSNAERQKLWRQRRNDLASRGVTPEMVVEAANKLWTRLAGEDPSLGSWEEMLANARTKRGRGVWIDMFPDRPLDDDDREFYGDDFDLIAKVAAVAHALRWPPAA